MGLELRRKPDGTLKSKYWYGSFVVNGKRHVVSLGIQVRGTPPEDARKPGNTAFEVSKSKAKDKLADQVAEARSRKSAESLVQDLHTIRYGSKIQSYPVADLVKAWDQIPKRRELHPRYVEDVHATVKRFVDFAAEQYPDIREAAQVTRTVARRFMEKEAGRKVAAKSWNDSLKRLRAVFRFLQIEYGVLQNPFEGVKAHEVHHIHRRPFTEEALKGLLEKVAGDDFCRPLIVCGLSTAMRLGDCCTLRWADVTLTPPNPNITVKTSKTGETVCIPIYAALMNELIRAQGNVDKNEEYVWPAQARMYKTNAHGVTWRMRQAFKAAGYGDKEVHAARQGSRRRASVRDFHSLRTTWITEALTRGVPIETVKLISGHKTVEVVTTHYFHPGQEQVRAALEGALPPLLTSGTTGSEGKDKKPLNPSELLGAALTKLAGVTPENCRRLAAEAAALVRPAKEWVDGRLLLAEKEPPGQT